MMADALVQRLAANPPEKRELGTKIRDGLVRVHGLLRSLSRGLILMEVDAEGLRAALEDLAARTSEAGTLCYFDCARGVTLADSAMATHLYRIAQEAVSNAVRHGKARHIQIALRQDGASVILSIQDDGTGMPVRAAPDDGMGIRIMHYRAGLIGGKVNIGPVKTGGTLVSCTAK